MDAIVIYSARHPARTKHLEIRRRRMTSLLHHAQDLVIIQYLDIIWCNDFGVNATKKIQNTSHATFSLGQPAALPVHQAEECQKEKCFFVFQRSETNRLFLNCENAFFFAVRIWT